MARAGTDNGCFALASAYFGISSGRTLTLVNGLEIEDSE
jgi:hypothetical protein